MNHLFCRHLRRLRLPDPADPHADAIPHPGLPALLHVRRRLVGVLPHQAGGRARPDGASRHPLPRFDQHLQLLEQELTKGGRYEHNPN